MRGVRYARLAFWGLAALAAGESLRALGLSRSQIDHAAVQAMQQTLASDETPVLAHRFWLGPQLRRWFTQAARPEHFAAASWEHWPEFWTLAHRSDPPTLPQLPDAQLVATIEHGNLVARRWHNPKAQSVIASLSGDQGQPFKLRAEVQEGPCRVQTNETLRLRCPDQSSLRLEQAEIDYRPRRCLAYRSFALGPLTLEFEIPWPKTGAEISGHLGFSDFNARLRSDAAVQLTIYQNDTRLLDRPFSDAQGWAPFSVSIPPPKEGQDTLTLRLRLQLNTSQTQFTSLERPVIPCLDLALVPPKRGDPS